MEISTLSLDDAKIVGNKNMYFLFSVRFVLYILYCTVYHLQYVQIYESIKVKIGIK